jgi:hypothetical protein
MSVYGEQSTVQGARTGLQESNVLMSDFEKDTLPAVNVALRNIKPMMEGIRGILPGMKNDGKVGGAAITGAVVGAGTGLPSASSVARRGTQRHSRLRRLGLGL